MPVSTAGADAVIREARRLFSERGVDATSMQEIADALGLHKSTLYHHVRSKEDLLERSCRTTLDHLGKSLDEAVARSDLSAAARLRLAFDGAVAVALDDVVGTNIVITLRSTSAIGRTVRGWRAAYEERFADLVRDAQLAGGVRDDVDPALFARVLLGTINGVVTWYREGDRFSADEIRHAVNTVLASAAADER